MIELNFPNPVSAQKDFYDRHEPLAQIKQSLSSGSVHSLVILGERRIGKTSLYVKSISFIKEALSAQFIPLLLPHGAVIRNFNDFARELLQALSKALDKNLAESGLMGPDGKLQLLSMGQLSEAIARLISKSNKTFIICMDEFDAALINSSPTDADKILGLTSYLAERADLPITTLFTITHSIRQTQGAFHAPDITKAEVIPLTPFSKEDLATMTSGLLGEKIAFPEAAQDRLYRLSGGHPYFSKLLLDCLIQRRLPADDIIQVTAQMVEQAAADAARDPRARHAVDNIYHIHFSEQEKAIMLLLAERNAPLSAQNIRQLGALYITAAKRLRRRGYLDQQEDGSYAFHIAFLGHWLREWEEYEEELERVEEEVLEW